MRFSFVFISLIVLTGCSHHVQKRMRPNEADIRLKQEIAFKEAVKKQRKLQTIVIDAGHGGDDFGCHSSILPVQHEKDLALTVSLMVDRYLRHQGYNTVLTRTDDTFIPLKGRSAIANQEKASLFVSIHFNSAPSKKAHGIEVFYYQSEITPLRSESSKLAAELVLEQLIEHTQSKSRGVKHGNLSVIRETKMPAILVESGFLTNDAEALKIKNASYLQNIALAISKGVHEFFNEKINVLVAQ